MTSWCWREHLLLETGIFSPVWLWATLLWMWLASFPCAEMLSLLVRTGSKSVCSLFSLTWLKSTVIFSAPSLGGPKDQMALMTQEATLFYQDISASTSLAAMFILLGNRLVYPPLCSFGVSIKLTCAKASLFTEEGLHTGPNRLPLCFSPDIFSSSSYPLESWMLSNWWIFLFYTCL